MATNEFSTSSSTYTDEEMRIIAEEYFRRRNILENNSSSQQDIEQKRRAWLEIAEHVNANSPINRTCTEIQRKVSDMTYCVKPKNFTNKANMAANKVSKRSPSYTNKEIHIIMDEYIRRKNILENNNTSQPNIEQKRKAWVEIAEHVNVISPTKRTYTEVRRKVSDMKCSAKRKMLRYLEQSLSNENKSSLIKPQIDERLLEILHENGVIPPYKSLLRRVVSEPGDIHRPADCEEIKKVKSPVEDLTFTTSTASMPGNAEAPSPTGTVDSLVVTDAATHTPSSGYDTQSDPNRTKHLRESVDRLTASVDKLGESLIKISSSLEQILESNQQMFNTINSNVVRILESQSNMQLSCLPPVNSQQR